MQGIHTATREIDESFEKVDQNGDHFISFDEFSTLMLELDHARTASSIRALFDKIDADHDDRVSIDEFRAWCC